MADTGISSGTPAVAAEPSSATASRSRHRHLRLRLGRAAKVGDIGENSSLKEQGDHDGRTALLPGVGKGSSEGELLVEASLLRVGKRSG
ncbi:unnamed protein product [Urochloa humidicola]